MGLKNKTKMHEWPHLSGVSAGRKGFTIVELLIVVAVIAILAAIVIVSYSGIRRSAIDSMVKDTAVALGKAMQTRKIESGVEAYPDTLPGSVVLADKVGAAITRTGSPSTFCINVTYKDINDIYYSISNDSSPKNELCLGSVIESTDNYNHNAGSDSTDGQDWVTDSSVGRVVAPGDMEFTAETNETWTRLTLSWKAMAGATQYRINQRDSPSAEWYVRSLASGSGYPWNTGSYSGNISSGTTSQTWTYNIPSTLSQDFSYRIQYKNTDGSWSEWNELTLSPLAGRELPRISNFKVVPNDDWSRVVLSWDGIGNFAKMPSVKFRINQRTSPTGTWYVRSPDSGSGWSWDTTSYSGNVSPTTTQQEWRYNIPQNIGSKYEYRIQIYSGSVASEWATFTLDPLRDNPVPEVRNFKVVPNSDWSRIVLSWDSIGDFAKKPSVKFRINQRTSPTGTWYVRNPDSSTGWAWDYPSYTGSVPPITTQQEWRFNIPPPGATYYYRIQMYSGSTQGEWAEFSLTR